MLYFFVIFGLVDNSMSLITKMFQNHSRDPCCEFWNLVRKTQKWGWAQVVLAHVILPVGARLKGGQNCLLVREGLETHPAKAALRGMSGKPLTQLQSVTRNSHIHMAHSFCLACVQWHPLVPLGPSAQWGSIAALLLLVRSLPPFVSTVEQSCPSFPEKTCKPVSKKLRNVPNRFLTLLSCLNFFHRHFFTGFAPAIQTQFQTQFHVFTTRICRQGPRSKLFVAQNLPFGTPSLTQNSP